MKRHPRRAVPLLTLGLGIVLGTFSVTAGGSFETVPTAVTATYDIRTETVTTDSVSVAYIGSYGVGFSAGGSANYDQREMIGPGGQTLNYQVVDSVGSGVVVKDIDGDATGSGLLTGRVLGTVSEAFDLVVPPGQLVSPGQYNDQLIATLYFDPGGQNRVDDTAAMGVTVSVPPYVAVRVVAPGGTYEGGAENARINFGTLAPGARQEIELLVRANVNYSVALDSINAGTMANLAAADTIPYRLEVDNVERVLSSGTTVVADGMGPTDLSGEPYRLAFEIGDTIGAASGTYQDVLTVTVTAQ